MGLRKQVKSGTKWTAISILVRQGFRWITSIILARLLLPSDYGLVGMAVVVINFIDLFKGLGTSAALIQKKNISDSLLSSVFWSNLFFGVLVTAIVFVLSPAIAYFFHEPRLTKIIRTLSLSFLVASFGIVQQAILEREFAFLKLAKIESCAVLTASITAILLALYGAGVWSLVMKSVIEAMVMAFMLLIYTSWKPTLRFSFSEVKSIFNYSVNLTAFNILNYFSRNADYILIGKYLGSIELGYYTLAYRIMFFPLLNISNAVARVVFPAYSRLQKDLDRFGNAYRNVVGAIAFITFPLMLGLTAVATPLVETLFGDKWKPMSILLIILSPVGLMQSVGVTSGGIYQATGRTDLMFRWGVLSSSVIVLSFLLGIRWGIHGIASAYAIATALLFYPNFVFSLNLINLSVSNLLSVLRMPFFCSMAMLIFVLGVKWFLPLGLSPATNLVLLVLTGASCYMLLSLIFNRGPLKSYLTY